MNGNTTHPAADITSYYDALTNAAARNSNQSLVSAGLFQGGGPSCGQENNILRNSHSGYSQNSNSIH